MVTWIILLLAMPWLAAGEPTGGGEMTPGAPSLQALASTRLEDYSLRLFEMWQDKLCAETITVPKTQCTIMREGKIYVVNKDDIPGLKEYGMVLLSRHYPRLYFLSKPLVFCCCCPKFIVAGITNSTSLQKGKEERVQRRLENWKKRYEALKGQTPYYDNFMKHQSARVDEASKEAIAKLKKAKTNVGKGANNEVAEFFQKAEEIRFNELEERLNKAEVIRAKRSDVW